ncbi:MAG TPA: choice-of-anchor tandem repeat GloVer-containing protein [Rhizomicrobium sp.]|nr:choice-of-anchor tandem repeat GloVer-containing protein [Rhizomicrobium sp.]
MASLHQVFVRIEEVKMRFGLAGAIGFFFLVLAGPASAKLQTLYSFCALDHCKDGAQPGALLRDAAGNLFGTAGRGPHYGNGVVFELLRGKRYRIIHTFCARGDCSDGAMPAGNLIIDTAGNLYGVTQTGGAQNAGTVFKLSPPQSGKKWGISTLYNFCSQGGCADGSNPSSGLTYAGATSGAPYDGNSPLYATTAAGGTGAGHGGTAYGLVPGGNGWTESVLYSFCSQGGSGCSDGNDPSGGLYIDANGNLFGTTASGGNSFNGGTIFELTANGDSWAELVLYAFCQSAQCQDGKAPNGPLIEPFPNILYGITQAGGLPCTNVNLNGQTCGNIFELNLNGPITESPVHDFCKTKDCADGAIPSSLILDASGVLYGTTLYGGGLDTDPLGKGGGTVFRFAGGNLSVMHNFCTQPNCGDGAYPTSLILGGSDEFFGSTLAGGAFGGGVVFHLHRSR